MNEPTPLKLAVVGAGPVGLALALHAANSLPEAEITLFDARPADKDVSGDPRTLALSLGSVQLLERLGAWRAESAQPILEVHVSQQAPSLAAAFASRFGEPALTIRAADEGVPLLGAVLSYGAIVAPLQEAWQAAVARAPKRLFSRFGASVAALKNVATPAGVEVDAGIAERFDLAVVAEGGVFAGAAKKEIVDGRRSPALRHDYGQTAWVGIASFAADPANPPAPGVAYERFTRHGPAALLPLKDGRAGLVWCVDSADDPVRELNDAQRVAVLNTVFHPRTPRIATLSPLKNFPLGLSAERTPHRWPHGAHRQRRADPAPGRRPGPQPRHARRLRAGALARPRARRRRGAAQARMAARTRPLGDDRGHGFSGPQLHLEVARRRRRARIGNRGSAGARAGQVGDRASNDVRLALSRDSPSTCSCERRYQLPLAPPPPDLPPPDDEDELLDDEALTLS